MELLDLVVAVVAVRIQSHLLLVMVVLVVRVSSFYHGHKTRDK
jgi:hypothetical protein